MTTNIVNDIAQQICFVDGDNQLSAAELAWGIASTEELARTLAVVRVADLIAFVERVNPDKTLGAGRLAELIVEEFDLDKES